MIKTEEWEMKRRITKE